MVYRLLVSHAVFIRLANFAPEWLIGALEPQQAILNILHPGGLLRIAIWRAAWLSIFVGLVPELLSEIRFMVPLPFAGITVNLLLIMARANAWHVCYFATKLALKSCFVKFHAVKCCVDQICHFAVKVHVLILLLELNGQYAIFYQGLVLEAEGVHRRFKFQILLSYPVLWYVGIFLFWGHI